MNHSNKFFSYSLAFVLILIMTITTVSAAPANKQWNDQTNDVRFYEWTQDGYKYNQQADRPSIDIAKIIQEYQDTDHELTLKMEFVESPKVDTSRYYQLYLTLETDNENSFIIQIFYSNYFGAQDSENTNSNQTIAVLRNSNSTGFAQESQNITTQLDGNALSWNIDMMNFTDIFGDMNYQYDSLIAQAVDVIKPGEENPTYYIDQYSPSGTTTSDDENASVSLPINLRFITSFGLLIIPILLIRKYKENK